MTGASSDTRDSELVRKLPSRDEIAKLLFDMRQSGHDWETAIDGDPESDAGELASICREDADEVLVLISQSLAADTIDRLTSTGVTRGHLYDHWLVAVQCDHEAKTDTAVCSCSRWKDVPHASVGDAVKAWIDHVFAASPREGHVEVPVEWREETRLVKWADWIHDKSIEGALFGTVTNFERDLREIAAKMAEMRAALPHNQGETKP
jgi:hypothetical protein